MRGRTTLEKLVLGFGLLVFTGLIWFSLYSKGPDDVSPLKPTELLTQERTPDEPTASSEIPSNVAPEIPPAASAEVKAELAAQAPRKTITVDQFYEKYKDFNFANYMKSARPMMSPPKENAGILTFAHAAYVMTPQGEVLWRQSVMGDAYGGLTPDSCVSLRGPGANALGYLGQGNLQFFEGPEPKSIITVLHDVHYLVNYHDLSLWDQPNPSERVSTILYYKKDLSGRLQFQGRQTRWTDTFYTDNPNDCGYSP